MTNPKDPLIEQIAEFLHDEGGFDDAWPNHTWPEHPDDTGQRDGGFVKIVPTDVQAKFRDVAERMMRGFPALSRPQPAPASRPVHPAVEGEAVTCGDALASARKVYLGYMQEAADAIGDRLADGEAEKCLRGEMDSQHGLQIALRAVMTAHPAPASDVREALAWYGEQACLARLIHSEGDAGRHALAEDGGKRARAALSTPPAETSGADQ